MLREKLEELAGEIETFVAGLRSEAEAIVSEIESFGPTALEELRPLREEIFSVKSEIDTRLDELEAEIGEFRS